MTTSIQEDLRLLVRDVLREVLPTAIKKKAAQVVPLESAEVSSIDHELVSLNSDADLDAFVKRLARLCEDPAKCAELVDGVVRFRIAPIVSKTATTEPRKVIRVERGAVTERHVKQASEQGAALLLSRTAVLTPLGRDRAKALGVEVEREK